MFSVYKITNKINNKCYIGSSIRYKARWRQHKAIAFNSFGEEEDIDKNNEKNIIKINYSNNNEKTKEKKFF